ncbi:hypothetical protein PanWU01x14_317800 [Parasponia andersonii]|uniref:Uncharacterized protein n=1 Tax=Parasponia andersonii TaxID=3476 RepID=A0A2P5AMG8_PARAD|nr:hypothetical protein PanWU01x14_317800 [Parasponia andersonii]
MTFLGGIIESTNNSSNLRTLSISFAKVAGNFNVKSLNCSSKMLNGVIDGSKSPMIDHSNDTTTSQLTLKENCVCIKVNEKVLRNKLNLCQFSFIGRVFLSRGDAL